MSSRAIPSFLLAFLLALTFLPAGSAEAQPPAGSVPRVIRFSGTIPGAQGPTSVTLSLYRAQADETALWSEEQIVDADAAGRYTVLLGGSRSSGLPVELFVAADARWLGVQPAGGDELPRVLLVAVAYAVKAADADTIGGKPLSAFVLAGDRTGVGPDGLTYVDTRVLATGLAPGTGGTSSGGAGTANFIGMFTNTTTLGNSVIYQTPAGSIGVNTLAPAAAVHVMAPSAPAAYYDVYSNALGALPVVYRAARGTPFAPTAVQANDILGGLAVRGYGTSTFSAGRGQVMFRAAENWTDEANGTYLQFTTTPLGTGAWAERMRIAPDGKVGIGTSTPAQLLSVAGTVESTAGGFKFPDGTVQTTAAGGSAGPAGTYLRSNGAAWVASPILPGDVPALAPAQITGTAATRTGGNSFTGNQTVAGTVQATAFIGDGAGLTNVATSQLATLQAQIDTLQALLEKSTPAGAVLWARGLGGSGADAGSGVAFDPDGNIIVIGSFNGSVDFGGGALVSAGNTDIFVAKYAQNGAHVWSRRFGATGSDGGYAVATDRFANVYLTGAIDGAVDFGLGPVGDLGGVDAFLVKLRPTGQTMWAKGVGAARFATEGSDVAIDSQNNVLWTGDFGGTANFGGSVLVSAGGQDIFLAKYTTAGAHVWSKRFGDSQPQSAEAVATDATDDVIITGNFQGTVDFGGGGLTSAGASDAFVARFTSAGAHSWSKRFGAASWEAGAALATDGAGNVICSGTFAASITLGGPTFTSLGSNDFYVAKFSREGEHLWSRSFGSDAAEALTGLAVDADNNVVMTGHASKDIGFGGGLLVPAGQSDVFVATLAPDGTHVWSEFLGGPGFDRGNGVAVDAAGRIAVTGYIASTASFGGKLVTFSGEADAYLALLHK